MKKFLNLFLFSLFMGFITCCQTRQSAIIDGTLLDSLFQKLSELDLAHGSVAISKYHQIIYQRELGNAWINDTIKYPSGPETGYRVGSVSKLFTAVIILQLVEKKQLTLDHRLSEYLPQIPNAHLITIENLLNHSSGLANYTDQPEFQQWKYQPKSRSELVAIIESIEPGFSPGIKHQYSNSNFLLLSLIIEEITGKTYNQVLNERILDNLGMQDTYYEKASDTTLKASKSYKYLDHQWIQQTEDVAENHMGAGAIVSTPADLLTFIDALFSNRLIDRRSLTSMITIQQDYGLGISPFQFGSRLAYGHEGRINEYYTTLLHFPDEELSIAYCTNGIMYPRDDIMKALVQITHGENYSLPEFKGVNIANLNSLKSLAGNYTSDDISIKVICKVKDHRLIVETNGTDFSTIEIGDNYFANFQYGYFFEFLPGKEVLLIKETDNVYRLKKER